MSPCISHGTQDTGLDRLVSAMVEAMIEAGPGHDGDLWLTTVARTVLTHVAAELIVLEQIHRRPLSLQEAARFLCQEAER